jgi:hypothetical protein
MSTVNVVTERICLVCTSPPGSNDIGLCDGHYFQYMVACASGKREEFVQKMDKQQLIGRVRHRQRYQYKPLSYGFGQP